MSMSGQRRLELERARREALRLQQVRLECEALSRQCDEELRTVRDVAVQQFAASDLREVLPSLTEARDQVSAAPDDALLALHDVQSRIQRAIATAEGQARSWSEEQVTAVAEARAAVAGVRAAAESAQDVDGQFDDAVRLAAEAIEHAEAGRQADAQRLTAAAVDAGRASSTTALDERVRREVVRGLLKTLKGMGFQIVGPNIDEGVVVLEGRLASGRRARFEVKVDGQMAFDLDGYEGRSCATDLEKVESVMRDRYGVKLGPPQVVWKNPDRLTRGAKDAPLGGRKKGT